MFHDLFKFIKSQDALGYQVTLNYKEHKAFGTVLGGFCSIFVSLLIAFFVFLQFWAFLFKRSF